MNADTPTKIAAEKASKGDDQKRERSSIKFPYMDLDDATAVARAIHETTGGSACAHDQLAAKLGLSMNSSGFQVRLAAARLFGVIDPERSDGGVKLTQLGQMIVDPTRQREAKVKAFLAVPLYGKLYEHYRGKMLPPSSALEREMANMGVAEKQTDKARQTFERSANTAGFFEMGKDRLIAPGIASDSSDTTSRKPVEDEHGRNGGGKPPSGLHPFIQGLLQTLPAPESEWDVGARTKWLQTAANIFDLIYKGGGGIEVRAAGAHRSPRPQDE